MHFRKIGSDILVTKPYHRECHTVHYIGEGTTAKKSRAALIANHRQPDFLALVAVAFTSQANYYKFFFKLSHLQTKFGVCSFALNHIANHSSGQFVFLIQDLCSRRHSLHLAARILRQLFAEDVRILR
jgi:hypothetical protein